MRDASKKVGSDLGPLLLALARRAVEERVRTGESPPVPENSEDPRLAQPGATFVTLLAEGKLRGCLGTLEARRPLIEDLWANAIAAATRDPRFPPLTIEELPRLAIEISVLGPSRPTAFRSRPEAEAGLRPGIDGVTLRWRRHRATFLPQVWQQLPDPGAFLDQLLKKAELAADFWAEDLEIETYRVDKYME